ncbi:hypothetical protein [Nioella halotolerans]|uniref:hypothetical protein n=1 Tax=Nioella halotolerans TaxID=2303578 RepID=UPI003F65C539
MVRILTTQRRHARPVRDRLDHAPLAGIVFARQRDNLVGNSGGARRRPRPEALT